jgi:hypothetical protein
MTALFDIALAEVAASEEQTDRDWILCQCSFKKTKQMLFFPLRKNPCVYFKELETLGWRPTNI